jgi:hypothetical protein
MNIQRVDAGEDPRVTIMRNLMQKIPLNELGLPEGIYRPDLLAFPSPLLSIPSTSAFPAPSDPAGPSDPTDTPSDPGSQDAGITGELLLQPPLALQDEEPAEQLSLGVSCDPVSEGSLPSLPSEDASSAELELMLPQRQMPTSDELQAAYMPLQYPEGYPALADGLPFWTQLDFEPTEAYLAFEAYVQQGQDGARRLFELGPLARSHAVQNGVEAEYPLGKIQEYYYLYYWAYRARAHDLFQTAIARKHQDRMIAKLNKAHGEQAGQLVLKALDYINSDEFTDLMTPKTAIELLKFAISWQRIALGLPANGPAEEAESKNQSLEVTLRNIAEKSGERPRQVLDEVGNDISNLLLQDPDTAAKAQELIIRINGSGVRKLN